MSTLTEVKKEDVGTRIVDLGRKPHNHSWAERGRGVDHPDPHSRRLPRDQGYPVRVEREQGTRLLETK